MHRFVAVRMLCCLAFCASCATSPGGGRHPVANRNMLSGDEIRAAGVSDAYVAVRQLRAEFLNRRGTPQFGSSLVFYIDGARVLDATALRPVSAEAVGRASRSFIERWKHADPEYRPLLADAQRRVERLRANPKRPALAR